MNIQSQQSKTYVSLITILNDVYLQFRCSAPPVKVTGPPLMEAF